jgi:hypothetical protein
MGRFIMRTGKHAMNTLGKILIMDDNKPIRDLVGHLLSWLVLLC